MRNLGFACLMVLALAVYLLSQAPAPTPDPALATLARIEAGSLP